MESINEACQSAADSRRCAYVNNFQVRFGNYWLGKVKLVICDGFSSVHISAISMPGLITGGKPKIQLANLWRIGTPSSAMSSSAIFWLALLQRKAK
jgi:hypothetical protein